MRIWKTNILSTLEKRTMIERIPFRASEVWRKEYRSRRYLQSLRVGELRSRLAYLAENLTTVEPDGKLGVLGTDVPLWQALVEACEEVALRRESVEEFLKAAKMPTPTFPSVARVSAAYARRRDGREGQFCKFGEARYLRTLVDHGNLRLFAASRYSDPSLNSAVQDDELGLTWRTSSQNLQISLPDGTISTPGIVRDFGGRTEYVCDFYVWCLSRGLHNRLLADFSGSDCIAVIYDMNGFLGSIRRAIQTELPGWFLCFESVTYVDPYNLPNWGKPAAMPYCKHHKYFYQHEWRIVIHPPNRRAPKLPPVDLKLDLSPNALELISV
jgi:hypothetical protein